MERAQDGHVIPLEHTIVPVEPDEALAALKEFLDSLDPDGIGELVTNLDEDLRGQRRRPQRRPGRAVAARVDLRRQRRRAAPHRRQLRPPQRHARHPRAAAGRGARRLRRGQRRCSPTSARASRISSAASPTCPADGLELVGEHATALRADIETLADAAATIDANLASVTQLLDAGALLTTGLLGAYNPELRAIDLRNNFSPLITEVLDVILGELGLPPLCVPVLQDCPVAGAAAGTGRPTIAALERPTTPVGSLLDLLSQPAAPAPAPGPGPVERARRPARRRRQHPPGGGPVIARRRLLARGARGRDSLPAARCPGRWRARWSSPPPSTTSATSCAATPCRSPTSASARHGHRAHRRLPGRGHDAVKDGLDLPLDSEAVLRTTSLLGEKFIELRPHREGASEGAGHPRSTAPSWLAPARRPSSSSWPRRRSRCSPAWSTQRPGHPHRDGCGRLRRPRRRAGEPHRQPLDRERRARRPDRQHRRHHRRPRPGDGHPRRGSRTGSTSSW